MAKGRMAVLHCRPGSVQSLGEEAWRPVLGTWVSRGMGQ